MTNNEQSMIKGDNPVNSLCRLRVKWALESRVVWDCNSNIGISSISKTKYGEDTNSTQVL